MRRAAALLALATLPALAQVQQLWESPAASVSQNLGLTRVEIDYHRPGVKGREIWGRLVPYGQVWRAGANDATTLSFSSDVRVAGRPVPKGTYALFVLPQKERWTLILSKEPKQWGAFSYKADQDLLRLDLVPQAVPHQEWLNFGLELKGRATLEASLSWEKLRVSFPIEADVDGVYQAYLREELARAESKPPQEAWSTFFVAGKYHLNGGRVAEAAPLLERALALKETFWTVEWKARLLQKQGRTAEALPLLERAKALAEGKAPKEYVAGLEDLRREWAGK